MLLLYFFGGTNFTCLVFFPSFSQAKNKDSCFCYDAHCVFGFVYLYSTGTFWYESSPTHTFKSQTSFSQQNFQLLQSKGSARLHSHCVTSGFLIFFVWRVTFCENCSLIIYISYLCATTNDGCYQGSIRNNLFVITREKLRTSDLWTLPKWELMLKILHIWHKIPHRYNSKLWNCIYWVS